MSDLPRRSLAADTSWLLLAKTLAFGVTFVLPILLVRQLSQEDFGIYRQVYLLVNTAIAMLPFGFVMSAFYFLPRAGDRRSAVAINILLVYAALAAVAAAVLFIEPRVLAAIFANPALETYSRLVAGVLFLTVLSTFVDLLALANGDVRSAALFIVTTNVAKTIMLAVAAIVFATVQSILVASALHGLLQVLFLFAYLRRGFRPMEWKPDLILLRQQLAYAIPLGLAAWLYWLQMESHHYFVARAFGPAQYAIYAIGCAGIPLTFMFGESVASVLIHRISELHSQERSDDIVAAVGEAARNLAAVYLPLYAILMLTGRELIAIVYTPAFLASWPIFAIGLTLLLLAIPGVINDSVIRSYQECRRFLVGVRMGLVAVLVVTLAIITPRYGPLAAISAMVAINAVERLVIARRVGRALQIRWSEVAFTKGTLGAFGTTAVAAAAALIVRLMLPKLACAVTLAVTGSVFAVVYFGSLALRGARPSVAREEVA